MTNEIVEKSIGLAMAVIGSLILYVECLFFSALHDVFSWVASIANAPDSLALVLTVVTVIVLFIAVIIVSLIGSLGVVIGILLMAGWFDFN